MKTPLSVHILYHSACAEGSQIYSWAYKHLCRDSSSPYMDGLDIPVYFCTGDENGVNGIVDANSERTLLLMLVDVNMVCSSAWRGYIKNEIFAKRTDSVKVVGVKLDEHAFSLFEGISSVQMITLPSNHIQDNIEEFQTRLYDVIIRYLRGKENDKLSIFISHSKHDNDHKGEELAISLRKFLFSDTKLGSFFDVHDILDGARFDKQIKENVRKSLFLILLTDTYSSREWCRIESLTAKENKIPIIAVSHLSQGTSRLFPYVANVPLVVYGGDWRPIVNLLLRTAVDYYYESELLGSLCDITSDYLPYPPEAHSLSVISTSKDTIYYPEPPLGNEEMSVLDRISSQMNRNLSFHTPMEWISGQFHLNDAQVAISVGDSENLSSIGVGEELLKDLTIELSRHILKAGGKMIYGGDLRMGGYTQLFRNLSEQYGKYEKDANDVIYFKNFLAWPIYNGLSIQDKADYICNRVELIQVSPSDDVKADLKDKFIPPVDDESRFMWATSLTLMRHEEEQVAHARVLVGGKIQGFKGSMPGIVEEFLMAREKNHPIYVIGGFGGAAQIISQIIERRGDVTSEKLLQLTMTNPEYKSLYECYQIKRCPISYAQLDDVKNEDLNNGLSPEENNRLFHSVNVIEIVSLVLKGLKNKLG